MSDPRTVLTAVFDAAVGAASPAHCMARWTPAKPAGRVLVVGAGKAAAAMASELEILWGEPLDGTVIVPYGHGVACKSINVVEAAHPVPDQAGHATSLAQRFTTNA